MGVGLLYVILENYEHIVCFLEGCFGNISYSYVVVRWKMVEQICFSDTAILHARGYEARDRAEFIDS